MLVYGQFNYFHRKRCKVKKIRELIGDEDQSRCHLVKLAYLIEKVGPSEDLQKQLSSGNPISRQLQYATKKPTAPIFG
jgi:hypothetical protein